MGSTPVPNRTSERPLEGRRSKRRPTAKDYEMLQFCSFFLCPSRLVLDSPFWNVPYSAEIFDAVTGAFTATGSPLFVRVQHTAELLPSGLVFVVGTNGAGFV